MKSKVKYISIVVLVTIFVISVYYFFKGNSKLLSGFGSFFGGLIGTIFSGGAMLLLYKTLKAQQKANTTLKITSFETTFFNLLRTQQEITNEINADFYSLRAKENIQRRKFFEKSKSELNKIWNSLKEEKYIGMFGFDRTYSDNVKNELDEISDPNKFNQDCFESKKEKIVKRENFRYTNKYYGITKEKWDEFNKLSSMEEKTKMMYEIYFNRYHYAVGHYFRHLYNIINFVDNYKDINEEEKQKYINYIQAQMSSFELMLLYYNVTSHLNHLELLGKYDFLENLKEEDLIDPEHHCLKGIKLKQRLS